MKGGDKPIMDYEQINYIFFFLLLLIADLSYSFVQYLSMPLDGDMAGGIVPADDVKPVLADPFGFSVLVQNAVYPNPNRFFAHWTFYSYFRVVPGLLQNLVDPIDSVYLACALAKIGIQIALITLIAFCITGRLKIMSRDFLLVAILISPLFQTNGYRSFMGIIDPSTTYTFFYALPCALIMLFYLPFFMASFHKKPFKNNKIILFFLFLLSIFSTLNGPLVPGIVLVISMLFVLKNWSDIYLAHEKLPFFQSVRLSISNIPKPQLLLFSMMSLLSIYSLFIGINNSIFIGENTPVFERYTRIPFGIYSIITKKIGFPVLLTMITINSFIIDKRFKNLEGRRMLIFFKWIGLFSILYIMLLPLGGYKSYRPNILRYDTIMPITIGLIFMYCVSAFYLIRALQGKSKTMYLIVVAAFTFIFTFADKPEFNKNECEKSALHEISNSKESIVLIESDCTILSWGKITDPKTSELNGQLLKDWGITKDSKLYYQK